MTDLYVLKELVIVLTATTAIVFVFQKLRLPTIVGFLLAGVIIGPDGLGLVKNPSAVEVLAEIGLVLLLFSIGLEISLEQIVALQKRILWAGLLQVGLTILAVTAAARAFAIGAEEGIFYGFLVALSSTAIVLRVYKDRGELGSIQGQLASATLFLQDLCIVPMILLVPVLGSAGETSVIEVLWALSKALVALFLIAWAARQLFPRLLRHVALLKNREIFILFVVLVCLGTAWLTSEAGLSLALGALVAGVVISESELSHQIVADVLPLRDTFNGIFFISIGMLLNLESLWPDLPRALLALALMIVIKILVAFAVFWRFYGSVRLGVLLATSLVPIGEFSFVLAKSGIGYQLLNAADEQIFLAASILSMMATPFLIQSVHPWAFGLDALAGRSSKAAAEVKISALDKQAEGHVIVVGYGVNGQNLARVLKEVSIPFRVLEMDPDRVLSARAEGVPIFFGDGTRPEILRQAGSKNARVLVVAISDPVATARVVAQARAERDDLYIVVRTRYVAEIDHLYRLGANQVIPEEFETSVEIFARVLQEYHIPRNVIALQVDLIRKEHYGTLRGLRLEAKQLDALSQYLAGTTTDICSILEDSPAAGKSLGALDLRGQSGATVIAVVRDGKSFVNVGPEFVLAAGDILVLLGDHKALDGAGRMIGPRRDGAEV